MKTNTQRIIRDFDKAVEAWEKTDEESIVLYLRKWLASELEGLVSIEEVLKLPSMQEQEAELFSLEMEEYHKREGRNELRQQLKSELSAGGKKGEGE